MVSVTVLVLVLITDTVPSIGIGDVKVAVGGVVGDPVGPHANVDGPGWTVGGAGNAPLTPVEPGSPAKP